MRTRGSTPTIVGGPLARCATKHSAMPRRVQYLRALGGGYTSWAVISASASYTRRPFRLDVGVSAPE